MKAKPRSVFFEEKKIDVDDELVNLRDELQKHFHSFSENLSVINRMGESKNQTISSIIRKMKRSYFNRTSKNQEVSRFKFISRFVKDLDYHNEMESFQDLVINQLDSLLTKHRSPLEIANLFKKTLWRKKEALTNLKANFIDKYMEIRSRGSYFKESEKRLRREIVNKVTLIDRNLEYVIDLWSKLDSISMITKHEIGDEDLSEKQIEQKYKEKLKEHLGFLGEEELRRFVNDSLNEAFCKKFLNFFKRCIQFLPLDVNCDFLMKSDRDVKAEIESSTRKYQFLVPENVEDIVDRLVEWSGRFKLTQDIKIDNGALLLYCVNECFSEKFIKQSSYLEFSRFTYKTYHLKKIFKKPDENEQAFGDAISNLEETLLKVQPPFKLVQWLFDFDEGLEASVNNYSKQQLYLFEQHIDSLVMCWIRSLDCNNIRVTSMTLESKVREHYDSNKVSKDLRLPEIFFEFYKGILQLVILKSRDSLVRILSYCNYFRSVQKRMNFRHYKDKKIAMGEAAAFREDKKNEGINLDLEKEEQLIELEEEEINSSPQVKLDIRKVNLKKQDLIYDQIFFEKNIPPQQFQDDNVRLIGEEGAEYVEITDLDGEQILYDIAIKDYKEIIEEIIKVSSYCVYLRRNNTNASLNKSNEQEVHPIDNIQREEITNKILELEAEFLYEKMMLIRGMKVLLRNSLTVKTRERHMENMLSKIKKRPSFNLFSDSIFASYELEINNLRTERTILEQSIAHVKQLENIVLDSSDSEFCDIENVQYFPIQIISLASKEYQQFVCLDKVSSCMFELERQKKVLQRLFQDKTALELQYIENQFLAKASDICLKLIEKEPFNQETMEFKMLEEDDLLDQPEKFAKIKYTFESNSKSDDQQLSKSKMSTFVKRKSSISSTTPPSDPSSPKRARFQTTFNLTSLIDILIISSNLLDFIKLRKEIQARILSSALAMRAYKNQINLFYPDPAKKATAINFSTAFKDSKNTAKFFFSMEGMSSVESDQLADWGSYVLSYKGMEDPYLVLQTYTILENWLTVGVTLNNFYLERVKYEFGNGDDNQISHYPSGNVAIRAKLLDSGQDYFYNVFEKKKRTLIAIITLQKVSNNSSIPFLANSNKAKSIKRIMGMRNENIDKVTRFCRRSEREIYHDIMKITVLCYNRQLICMVDRLPLDKPLFSVKPMSSSSKINLDDPNHDISSVFHSKLSKINRFLDHSLLNSNTQKSRIRDDNLSKMNSSIATGASFVDMKAEEVQETETFEKNIEDDDETYYDVLIDELKNSRGFYDDQGMMTNLFVLPSVEQILKVDYMEKKVDYKELQKNIVGEENVEKDPNEKRIAASNMDWNDEKEDAYLESKLKEFRNVDIGVVSPIKKKKKINTKALTTIQFKRNTNRNKVFKNQDLRFLENSPIFLMMSGLYHIYRILSMEMYTCTMDSSNLDHLYLSQGVLNEKFRRFHKINIEKIPEITRNLARVRQKITVLKEVTDKLEENITYFKENNVTSVDTLEQKVTSFNSAMMKQLKKQQKNKFNSLIVFLLHQLNILRRTETNIDLKNHLKNFLCKICLNKFPRFAIENGQPVFTLNLKDSKSILPQIQLKGSSANLYEDYSYYMNIIKETCINEKLAAIHTPSIFSFMEERIFNLTDIMMNDLQRLELNTRTELADSFFILENGVREHLNNNSTTMAKLNPYQFQKDYSKLMTGIIKYQIFKEIVTMFTLNFVPFQNMTVNFVDLVENKLQILDQYATEIGSLDQLTLLNQSLPKYLYNEKRINLRISILGNELEKIFVLESIQFYKIINPILAFHITNISYELDEPPITILDNPRLDIMENFLQEIKDKSCKIETLDQGVALVLPVEEVTPSVYGLNERIAQYVQDSYNHSIKFMHKKLQATNSDLTLEKRQKEHLENKRRYIMANFDEIVESRVAYKCNELFFKKDNVYKHVKYMRDEECLREREIKANTKKDFQEKIRDTKLNIQNYKNRFYDYKIGMTLDLKKYIKEAKEDSERLIREKINKVFLIDSKRSSIHETDTTSMQGKNPKQQLNTETLENDWNVIELAKSKDKQHLYNLIRTAKLFYSFRCVCLKEKYDKILKTKGVKLSSNDELWQKIAEMNKKEEIYKEKLSELGKNISVLEHKNTILQSKVKEATFEKIKLYKSSSQKASTILEIEENLRILKKQKAVNEIKDLSRPKSALNIKSQFTGSLLGKNLLQKSTDTFKNNMESLQTPFKAELKSDHKYTGGPLEIGFGSVANKLYQKALKGYASMDNLKVKDSVVESEHKWYNSKKKEKANDSVMNQMDYAKYLTHENEKKMGQKYPKIKNDSGVFITKKFNVLINEKGEVLNIKNPQGINEKLLAHKKNLFKI